MAKVTSLHPAPPAAERTPERDRLAAVIERHRTATAHLNRITAAQPRAWDLRIAARRTVQQAEAKLAAARAAEPRRLAQQMIDGAPDDEQPVQAAAAILADAHVGLDIAIATDKALGAEATAAEKELELAKFALRDAIAAVVAPSAAVAQLLAEYDAARAHLDALTTALNTIDHHFAMPKSAAGWYASNRPFPAVPSIAIPWANALAYLGDDPLTLLPGEPPANGENL